MPVGFGALLLRPDALPDANPPLFPGLGPAQWCAGLHTTEAEELAAEELEVWFGVGHWARGIGRMPVLYITGKSLADQQKICGAAVTDDTKRTKTNMERFQNL